VVANIIGFHNSARGGRGVVALKLDEVRHRLRLSHRRELRQRVSYGLGVLRMAILTGLGLSLNGGRGRRGVVAGSVLSVGACAGAGRARTSAALINLVLDEAGIAIAGVVACLIRHVG
jgi:hypothetical protein